MPINSVPNPQTGAQRQYQPSPQQPTHPGYSQAMYSAPQQGPAVWGQPVAFVGQVPASQPSYGYPAAQQPYTHHQGQGQPLYVPQPQPYHSYGGAAMPHQVMPTTVQPPPHPPAQFGGAQFDPFEHHVPQQQQQQQHQPTRPPQQQQSPAYSSPIPPPPEKTASSNYANPPAAGGPSPSGGNTYTSSAQQYYQQQQQPSPAAPMVATGAYAPPLLSGYPQMPSGTSAPVAEASTLNNSLPPQPLAFPCGPNGAPIGFPDAPDPSRDPRWKIQEGNAEDDILEHRVCRGIKLKDCELRNCYVIDCVVKDSLVKGGYFSSCKLKECEFQSTSCIISCTMDDSIAKWSGITNTQVKEGDLQKCNTLDSKVVDSNVWGGTAVRCDFRKCAIQNTYQENCRVSESSTSAKQSVP